MKLIRPRLNPLDFSYIIDKVPGFFIFLQGLRSMQQLLPCFFRFPPGFFQASITRKLEFS